MGSDSEHEISLSAGAREYADIDAPKKRDNPPGRFPTSPPAASFNWTYRTFPSTTWSANVSADVVDEVSRVLMSGIQDVSIVLVTYNRARFLPRTLDCLLQQTYPHFELLICDDASTDGTDELCRTIAARDSRVRYIRNESNMGMPGNLNNGIKLARHELIANLHDGDIYEPDLIESWRAALLRYPSAGFVFNQYVHLAPDEKAGAATGLLPEFMSGSEFLEDVVFTDSEVEFPVWGTVMGRRSIYLDLGFFDPRFSFWADVDMWCRIAEDYDVAYVPKPLIRLPSRIVMPHLFSDRMLTAHVYVYRLHWRARTRHYRLRRRKMATALLSMTARFVSIRSIKLVRRLRRKLAAFSRRGADKPNVAAPVRR